jgi:hypothetical protein
MGRNAYRSWSRIEQRHAGKREVADDWVSVLRYLGGGVLTDDADAQVRPKKD